MTIFGIHELTVGRIITRYSETHTFNNCSKSGHPKALSDRDGRNILREIKRRPKITIAELVAYGRLDASKSTIQRFLRAKNYGK